MTTLKATTTALVLALAMTPAHADDNLATRAMEALGIAIASQGNAALLQIQAELKEKLLESLRPELPSPATAPEQAPAEKRA